MPTKKNALRSVTQSLDELERAVQIAELNATLARTQARRMVMAVARDLIPTAASYARKGRPRLLAVVSRIIGDEKLSGHPPAK